MKTRKKRKPVYGKGINDADYVVHPTVNGKQKMCPYYKKWRSMLERCYSPALHDGRPTYKDCSVTPEWLSFMAFRAWMKAQDWEGNHLDKDFIFPENKVYSPDTCCFVSLALNNLLTDHGAKRGPYPQGVHWNKLHKRFQAGLKVDGRSVYLGHFDTPYEAHRAYLLAKTERILKIARALPIGPARGGLMVHAIETKAAHILGLQTPRRST